MSKLKLLGKLSKASYERMLVTLEKKGRDGFEILGDGMITALGATGGALSAGTVAALTGTTSIFGVTTAASWIGITVAAATPVGWIAGCAIAGGGLAYGISCVGKSGAVNTEKRKRLAEDIRKKIESFQDTAQEISEDEQFKKAIGILFTAHSKNKISQEDGMKLVKELKAGDIKPQEAVKKIGEICLAEHGME